MIESTHYKKGKRLFEELTERPIFTPGTCKGRNTELIDERNKCLLYRFYYYSKIRNFKYDDVITLLSRDFFISPRTVADVITRKHESVRQSFKEMKDMKELQDMYEFLNWKN